MTKNANFEFIQLKYLLIDFEHGFVWYDILEIPD